MGLVTKKALACDRCGTSIEVDEGFHSLSLTDRAWLNGRTLPIGD